MLHRYQSSLSARCRERPTAITKTQSSRVASSRTRIVAPSDIHALSGVVGAFRRSPFRRFAASPLRDPTSLLPNDLSQQVITVCRIGRPNSPAIPIGTGAGFRSSRMTCCDKSFFEKQRVLWRRGDFGRSDFGPERPGAGDFGRDDLAERLGAERLRPGRLGAERLRPGRLGAERLRPERLAGEAVRNCAGHQVSRFG